MRDRVNGCRDWVRLSVGRVDQARTLQAASRASSRSTSASWRASRRCWILCARSPRTKQTGRAVLMVCMRDRGMSEQVNLGAVLAIEHNTTSRESSRGKLRLFSCPGSLLIIGTESLLSTFRLISLFYTTPALW